MAVDTSIVPAPEGTNCDEPGCGGRAYYVIGGELRCWIHKNWAFDRLLCAALKEGYYDRANSLARVRLRELNAL